MSRRGCRPGSKRSRVSSTIDAIGSARTTRCCANLHVACWSRLDYIRLAPRRILDVGCGLGRCRADLLERYRDASWTGIELSESLAGAGRTEQRRGLGMARLWREVPRWIVADGARLPVADDSVDLVFSNLMLHWHPAPHLVLPEWKRVLRVDGLLMFSCFGPDTLVELRTAVAATLPRASPMPFVDMHDFGDMMVASGFATPVMDVERLTLTFASAAAVLAEVRALGGNPRDDRPAALPSGRQARSLLRALDAQRNAEGRIPLTFEIAYGHAWKPAARRFARQYREPRAAARARLARKEVTQPVSADHLPLRPAFLRRRGEPTGGKMSLISFMKEAGEKLFGKKVQETYAAPAKADPAALDAANREAATAIENHINTLGLTITALTVTFDGATGVAKVYGVAKDQATKEKAILAAGNVQGVSGVEDNMTVDLSQPAAKFYTVVKGDTLSKIAKEFYGNANDYMKIFEANKPMLSHPDKIYPGQNLRIPAE